MIKIEVTNGKQYIDGRTLHKAIGSKQNFTTWMMARIRQGHFSEKTDYQIEGRHNYKLSLAMAKTVCALEKLGKGEQLQKFIEDILQKQISETKELKPENYLLIRRTNNE
jgi:phage anti-repressor protein